MEAPVVRRLKTLDALVLTAATAVALVPGLSVWPEALAVFRKLDFTHVWEDGLGKTIFAEKCQTGRMDSMAVMGRYGLATVPRRSRPPADGPTPEGTG